MASLGLSVPPGFTMTTDVCVYYYDHDESYPDDLDAQVVAGLASIEALTDKTFGDATKPIACLCAFGRAGLHAGHDGHSFEFRAE